ncbi:MAG: hypothetical protein U0136_05585 [Bdellovibrionota bacterium]
MQKPQDPTLQVLQLVCLSFIFAVVGLGIIPFISSGAAPDTAPAPLDQTGTILVAVGLLLLVSAAPIGRLLLRPDAAPAISLMRYTPGSFFRARLVTFALWEAVALCGFLVYSFQHNLTICLTLSGAALGAMIGYFPRASQNSIANAGFAE